MQTPVIKPLYFCILSNGTTVGSNKRLEFSSSAADSRLSLMPTERQRFYLIGNSTIEITNPFFYYNNVVLFYE